MSERIPVLLVEDDEPLRESLAAYLRLQGFDVAAVGDGLSFYRRLAQARFPVLVIDLGLPDQAGEVLVDYARRNTDCAIVVVTARDDIETRVGTYQSGADLFLAKPVNGRELAAALASLATRRVSAPPTPRRAPWRLSSRERTLSGPGGGRVELTPKEHRFVQLLAASAGNAVRRQELLEALYGRDDDSAARALETLVRRTRQTIADGTGGLAPILTEHGTGYAFTDDVVLE